MPHKDPAAYKKYHADYQKVWREKNPDKISEYRKRHYGKYKEYYSERARKWREANPVKHAANWRSWSYSTRLERKYGLSTEQFESLLKRQNYSCAICREPFTSPKNRHVDHCHDTKVVRGILCNKCNLAVGLMQNSPKIALEAAHYLNQQPAQ